MPLRMNRTKLCGHIHQDVQAVVRVVATGVTEFASFVNAPTLRPTLGEHRSAPLVSHGLDLTRIGCQLGVDEPVINVEP